MINGIGSSARFTRSSFVNGCVVSPSTQWNFKMISLPFNSESSRSNMGLLFAARVAHSPRRFSCSPTLGRSVYLFSELFLVPVPWRRGSSSVALSAVTRARRFGRMRLQSLQRAKHTLIWRSYMRRRGSLKMPLWLTIRSRGVIQDDGRRMNEPAVFCKNEAGFRRRWNIIERLSD